MINIPDDCGYQVVGNMMRSSESLKDGHHGAKPQRKHRTETIILFGIIVSGKPYAPAGAEKGGECEGDIFDIEYFRNDTR